MRFSDIQLKETTEELQELTEFSELIADYLFKYYIEYSKNPEIQKLQKERIKEIVPLSQNIKNWLGFKKAHKGTAGKYAPLMWPIKLSSVPGADNFKSPGLELLKKYATASVGVFEKATVPALYSPSTKNIVLNVDYIFDDNAIISFKNFFNGLLNKEEIKKPDSKFLGSSIAHEAQHAIDDFKSRMKTAKDSSTLPGAEANQATVIPIKSKKDKTDDFTNYLRYNHEVNARFTEVIRDIKDEIKRKNYKDLNKNQMLDLIKDAFKMHWMDKAFPEGFKNKNYQKLIKRAYLYLTAYQNNTLAKSKGFDLKSEPKTKTVVAKPIEKPSPTTAPKPQPNYRGSSIYKGIDQAINKPLDYKKLIKSKPYALAENTKQ